MIRDGFISVYRSDTGEKVSVPEAWRDNPVLWDGFRMTPLSKRAEVEKATEAEKPAEAAQK